LKPTTTFIAGPPEESIRFLEPVEQLSNPDIYAQNGLFLRRVLLGETHRIPELLTSKFVAAEKKDITMSTWAATFFIMLGDFSQALDWLENSVNRGFIKLSLPPRLRSFLARLRGEPRFEQLMQRVKREWESFEG